METDPVSETLCSLMFLEYQKMYKVQNPSNPKCHTPSLEPFRIYLCSELLVIHGSGGGNSMDN
jgi:hypothetical protein